MPASSDPARLALDLAAFGSAHPAAVPGPADGRSATVAMPAPARQPRDLAGACPCLPAAAVPRRPRRHHRPRTITAWSAPRAPRGARRRRRASGLILVDIDAHGGRPPPILATGLLPGIDLAAEPIPTGAWADPASPGRRRQPGPAGPAPRRSRPWPTGPITAGIAATLPAGCTCGTRPPPPTSTRRSATPRPATGWPGKSTSKPDGPTASPPARPPPQAPTRSAAATRHSGRMPAWLAQRGRPRHHHRHVGPSARRHRLPADRTGRLPRHRHAAAPSSSAPGRRRNAPCPLWPTRRRTPPTGRVPPRTSNQAAHRRDRRRLGWHQYRIVNRAITNGVGQAVHAARFLFDGLASRAHLTEHSRCQKARQSISRQAHHVGICADLGLGRRTFYEGASVSSTGHSDYPHPSD